MWCDAPVVIACAIRKLAKKGSAQERVTLSLAAVDPPSRNPMSSLTLLAFVAEVTAAPLVCAACQ